MRPLTAQDILEVWEGGTALDPVDRPLFLLATARPEKTADELAVSTIGERNAGLLALRAQIFGSELRGYTECPQCGERLVFAVRSSELPVVEREERAKTELDLVEQDWSIRFRLPNSRDLAVARACENVADACRELVERSVLEAKRGSVLVPARELPPELWNRLAERMAQVDPAAEILLDFECPACGVTWQRLLDLPAFLWAELTALAKRLLYEVHTLARAYGWRERDILSMSAVRRQCYLEMIGG